jgi:hypothetical protein
MLKPFPYVKGERVTQLLLSYVVCCAVPPAYYAHLVAFRARCYMDPDAVSDSVSSMTSGFGASGQSVTSRRTNHMAGDRSIHSLPPLKDNVKKVMFYCFVEKSYGFTLLCIHGHATQIQQQPGGFLGS